MISLIQKLKVKKKMDQKIEIELDQELYMNLHIIAKGLDFDLNQCLLFILRKEVKFLKDNIHLDNAKNDLEEYYNREIDKKTLKKLINYEVKNMSNEVKELMKIEIPRKVYQDLQFLCKINNWDTDKKIVKILEVSVESAEILDGEFKQVINF